MRDKFVHDSHPPKKYLKICNRAHFLFVMYLNNFSSMETAEPSFCWVAFLSPALLYRNCYHIWLWLGLVLAISDKKCLMVAEPTLYNPEDCLSMVLIGVHLSQWADDKHILFSNASSFSSVLLCIPQQVCRVLCIWPLGCALAGSRGATPLNLCRFSSPEHGYVHLFKLG